MKIKTNNMKEVFKIEIAGHQITLMQNSKGEFVVQYGYQQFTTKYYAEASKELGKCIMHALACEGKITDETE